MNSSLLSVWRIRAVAMALALVGASAFFFFTASSVLAADTILTKQYQETGTSDGTVDRVRIQFDENVIACTYDAADWTINTAGSIGITAITSLSCTTTDAILDLIVTTTANVTGGATEPVISYANASQPNSIVLTAGVLTAKANQTLTDSANPQINTFSYQDNDGDAKIDRVLVTFSEEVVADSVLTPAGLLFGNVGDFTGAVFGADTTDSVAGTVSTATLTLGTESTVLDTNDGSGNIAITTQGTFRLDDAGGNSNTTLGAQAAIATFLDAAAPQISTMTYSDADGDGKVDTIAVAYSESVVVASVISHNDLTLTGVGDFTALAFGATSTDLITGTVASTTITLGTESSVQDTEENAGTIAISTQNAFRLDDATGNSNTTLGAQAAIGSIVDGAKPVITTFTYQDAVSDDGKIDTIVAAFSEEVVVGSVLTPAGLAFSNVGDFTGAVFGTDTTDAIAGTVTSATLTLGTAATAVDTADSGSIAITSDTATDTFSLVDTATTPNTNTTLGAQSVSATFVDGADPQIETITYSDADGDAKIDTITLAYSESVGADSVMKRNDILATVGDFTALAIGTDAVTDLITGTVTSTTITVTTESTAEDTNDVSANFDITSQNDFSLVDIATTPNTNADLEAQKGSSATVVDGARPMLLTTSPASAATGVSRSATTVLTFSEPITTASFAWTHSASPAAADFAAAWTVLNSVVTLTPAGLLSSGTHTVTVTAAPDPTANTYNAAVAAIANPFSYTVTSSSSVSSGTGSSSATYDVGVTSPNGGETFNAGDSVEIAWTSTGGSAMSAVNINLSYVDDTGSTVQATIIEDTTNDGSYTWTVPGIDTAQAKIQVVGTDLSATLALDVSDEYFAIVWDGTTVVSDDTSSDDDVVSDDEVDAPSSGETGPSPVTGEIEDISVVAAGDYIKSPYFSSVYYLELNDDGDLIRRPFIDSQTYFTYEDNFDGVMTVTDATLPTMSLGGPMLPNGGVVLVKIQSVAKVYAVTATGELRWVPSETIAAIIYGSNWADYVIDIPDTLFPRFDMGTDVQSSEDIDTSGMKTRAEVNS